MQVLACALQAPDRPEDQRAVETLGINPGIRQPTLTAPLAAGRQGMPQQQADLPVVKTDRLTQQQLGHHPAQEHQITLFSGWAVLTEKAGQLAVEPGGGNPRGIGLV